MEPCCPQRCPATAHASWLLLSHLPHSLPSALGPPPNKPLSPEILSSGQGIPYHKAHGDPTEDEESASTSTKRGHQGARLRGPLCDSRRECSEAHAVLPGTHRARKGCQPCLSLAPPAKVRICGFLKRQWGDKGFLSSPFYFPMFTAF